MVIKGFKRAKKRSQKVIFLLFENDWKNGQYTFLRVKYQQQKHFSSKKQNMWTYFFNIKKIFLKIGNCPIMKKLGQLGQFCWQIWVPCQISNMKLLLNCNFVKFWKNIYLATKWSWYLGLYHIYIFIYIYIFLKPTALREGRSIPCCCVAKCCEITARGD